MIGHHRLVDESEDAYWNRLFDVYEPYYMTILLDDPAETIDLIRDLADAAPDDCHLGPMTIVLVETYLGVHGEVAYAHFESALRRSAKLRAAWSKALSDIPDEWEARFDAADDEAGGAP